ncbi:MAG: hypothetical protein C0483_18140 [Pirellula sp.]|nr:hypothetical protein [Pirellula sp.]
MTLPHFLALAPAVFSRRNRNQLSRTHRSGFSRLDGMILAAILVAAAFFLLQFLPLTQQATGGYQNMCRYNLSNMAKALFSYGNRNGGKLPGYINALNRKDGSLYIDPDTGKATPVSWAVMVLSDIDRQTTFEQWQKVPGDTNAKPTTSDEPKQSNFLVSTKLYVDLFICPSDPAPQKIGTPISYVVGTGLPDAPLSATAPDTKDADGNVVRGIPRDWQSSGMFFDNYTSDPRVTLDAKRRPRDVVMRMELCTRPKDKTILLTENVDAGDYTLDANRDAADDWRRAEIALGATWSADIVEPDGKTLRKRPQPPALHPNERVGQGSGSEMAFARPSGRHPGGFNVAYVGQNVQFVRDTIDYYVWAKLMTSSDTDLMLPGTRTPIAGLGSVQLTDELINP